MAPQREGGRAAVNSPLRIGLDFDNTVAGYDRVFLDAAKAAELLPEDFVGRKLDVRNAVRLLEDGETEWQRLQSLVYGELMSQAVMIEGVEEFLLACRDRDISVAIISHKTEFSNFDPGSVSFHDAARGWLTSHGFFANERFALTAEDVYFETTRANKIARISEVGCSHFVDDLEEVLRDPCFPNDVNALLYTGETDDIPTGPFTACRDWREIADVILG